LEFALFASVRVVEVEGELVQGESVSKAVVLEERVLARPFLMRNDFGPDGYTSRLNAGGEAPDAEFNVEFQTQRAAFVNTIGRG